MSKAGTTEREAPLSLDQRLAAARQAAQTARAHLDSLDVRLRTAVEAADYDQAAELKGQIPDASHAWAVAAAEQRALESVIEELSRQAAERAAREQAERRKQQAQVNLDRAAETERQLMDELSQVRAELVAGVEAVQLTIRRGYQLEQQVRQARTEQAQARVDSGEAAGLPGHIAAPNPISSLVESRSALVALLHGTALSQP